MTDALLRDHVLGRLRAKGLVGSVATLDLSSLFLFSLITRTIVIESHQPLH